MSSGVLYASPDELRATLDITDTASDFEIELALSAASRWVEHECGRQFTVDAADVTQVLFPKDSQTLQVVDLLTITTLKVDTNGDRTYATSLTSSDYLLWPPNEPRAQEIRIWPTSSRAFYPGNLVQLVGKSGCVDGGAIGSTSGTTPDDVRRAVLIQAARFYKRREAPFGVLSAVDLGQFARLAQDDPDVRALLEPWKRTARWVLV